MSGDMAPLFWGFLLGAGVVWLFCCQRPVGGPRASAPRVRVRVRVAVRVTVRMGSRAVTARMGKTDPPRSGGCHSRGFGGCSPRHTRSNPDKVTVLRNRLGEIRGPLSGKDVITLLKPVSSRGNSMEVLRLLMPRVHSTVPDKEFDRILSMLSSGDVAEKASELLRR